MSILSSIALASLLVHSSLAAPVKRHSHEVEEKGYYEKPYTQTYEDYKYTPTYEYKPEKTYGGDYKYDEYKYESYKPEPTYYKEEEPPKYICKLPPKEVPWYGEYYKWAYGSYPPDYKSDYEYKSTSEYKGYDYKYDYKTDYKPEYEYKTEYKPEYEYKTDYKPEYKPEYKEYKPYYKEYKPDYKPDYKPEYKSEYKSEYKPEYTPPAYTTEVTSTPPLAESTPAATTSASSVESSAAESSSAAASTSTGIQQVTDPALNPAFVSEAAASINPTASIVPATGGAVSFSGPSTASLGVVLFGSLITLLL